MKNIFKNKSIKFYVIYFSSLMLSTSVIYPLTSCGGDNTSNDIGGFDKEFGFDAQTYTRLEQQFTNEYKNHLFNKKFTIEERNNKLSNFLKNDLTILRSKLFDPAQNYSFTVRTNTLLDYASKIFNIQLNRNANVSQIDFDNLRQSSLENFVICMENMRFTEDEIDKRKTVFNEKFDDILKDCKEKTIDNAQILMQLRANIIDCWQDLNDELAYLSSYNHLKNFFNEYEFKVKDQQVNNNNAYLWDNLLITSGFMGSKENCNKIDQDINHEISDYWINKLFTISKISESKKDDVNSTGDKQNDISADKIPVSYSEEIIPGYILKPVLKTMSQDIYSNHYYMVIDWQLMSNRYKGEEDQAIKDKVTAHLAYNKDGQIVNDIDSSSDVNDNNFSSDNYQFTRYSLMATPAYQQEKLAEAYFDQDKEPDQKITFTWNKDMIGLEYYLPDDASLDNDFKAPDKPYKVSMGRTNLSIMGLQLNNRGLSVLLSKKNNLQNSKSINNPNNDDNLKIEEKFVKYCDINNIANVSFSDNKISHNDIQNEFIAAFTNTNVKHVVEMKSIMKNIEPSHIFSANASYFYKKVSDYVDAGRIKDETEKWQWLSDTIKIELFILMGIMAILLVCSLATIRFSQQYVWKHFLTIIIVTAIASILAAIWISTVSDPINEEVKKVKDWNEYITKNTKPDSDKKINVIEKVNGDDKNNFKSYNDFVKYYETDSNSAFKSYFYYFHFVALSQKLTTDDKQLATSDEKKDQPTTLDKVVKQDYDDFNKTKETYKINDKFAARIAIAIIFFIILVCTIVALIIVCLDIKHARNQQPNPQGQQPGGGGQPAVDPNQQQNPQGQQPGGGGQPAVDPNQPPNPGAQHELVLPGQGQDNHIGDGGAGLQNAEHIANNAAQEMDNLADAIDHQGLPDINDMEWLVG